MVLTRLFQSLPQGWRPLRAKYTVMVSKLLLTNCVQAHDNMLKVLQHINLYLLTRRPQNIGFPGHTGTGFFGIPYFQKFCLSRPRKEFQKLTKNHQKYFAVLRPALPPYGAAPLPSTKVGAKCLAAVMLAHHDRVLSLGSKSAQLKGGINFKFHQMSF